MVPLGQLLDCMIEHYKFSIVLHACEREELPPNVWFQICIMTPL